MLVKQKGRNFHLPANWNGESVFALIGV